MERENKRYRIWIDRIELSIWDKAIEQSDKVKINIDKDIDLDVGCWTDEGEWHASWVEVDKLDLIIDFMKDIKKHLEEVKE